MKIAITADVHLTTREQNPERFQVLENILSSLVSSGIDTLIIAGDLFDSSIQNVAEFEAISMKQAFQDIKLIIIPGNHDPDLSNAHFSLQNLAIVSEPALVRIAEGAMPILFVPYLAKKNMGEAISNFANQLDPEKWILVGHGDWSSGLRMENSYEPGVFMPLTRQDIDTFLPAAVFLGHIHSPINRPPVYYAGSPCGLDITETGYRRILVCDLFSGSVEEMAIDTPTIFFNETFSVLPVENEEAFLRQQIAERVNGWGLESGDEPKVRLRVKLVGYSADRSRLLPIVEESLGSFSFYNDEPPDLSEVSVANDSERKLIANSVKSKIEEIARSAGSEDLDKDEIILDALHLIYGD